MGKISTIGKGDPRELNERQGPLKFCFNATKGKNRGKARPSTLGQNHLRRKTMLHVWWHQSNIVYYYLLKPSQNVKTKCYRQKTVNLIHAFVERRPEWTRRYSKVILLYDNALFHSAKPLKYTLTSFEWDIRLYSPDLALSYLTYSPQALAE